MPATAFATDLAPLAVPDRVRAAVTLSGAVSAPAGTDHDAALAHVRARQDLVAGQPGSCVPHGIARDIQLLFDAPVACPCDANRAINAMFARVSRWWP